ncbi:MAG TPA: NAD-binding protein [Gemmatimonadales bacterium]
MQLGPSPRNRPPAGSDAEFNRLRRRLRLAVGALVLVTGVGVLGFVLLGRGSHGLIDAVYMTVITLTTVGFGEIIDLSGNPAGRLFTIALLLIGMGIVAYTVPMLAAFVIEGQLHHIFRRRRMQNSIAQLSDHYVVCGDAAAGWYVAEELVKSGRPTVLVVPTEEMLEAALNHVGEVPAVTGDPSEEGVLLTAGTDRAAGIVFAMKEDKDNVLGVLTARRLAPKARIIAATERSETESKLRSVGADAIVSPSRIGGLRMASELVRPKVVSFLDQMLRDKGGSLRVEEVVVPTDGTGAGKTVEALGFRDLDGTVLLAARHPDGRFEFKPPPDTVLEPGMALIVMADAAGRERLVQRLGGRWDLSRS